MINLAILHDVPVNNFKHIVLCCFSLLTLPTLSAQENNDAWIRVNQLGYPPTGIKVAVLGTQRHQDTIESFTLVDANTATVVFSQDVGKDFGPYGPFHTTYRLDFTAIAAPGTYYLQVGSVRSPLFEISHELYRGTADFALRYNGFILLIHLGTDPRRKDAFYDQLDTLLHTLKDKGYHFVTVDALLH